LSVGYGDKDGDLGEYPALGFNHNQPCSTSLGQGVGDPAGDKQGN
jgi:hypothetical protein